MWLVSDTPDDLQDDTMREKHGTEALNSTVNCLLHGIQTEDQEARNDISHHVLRFAQPWTMSRGLKLQFAN